MTVQEALMNRRSIRKFKQVPIEKKLLSEIVKTGKMAPTRANRQPLKFVIIDEPKLVREIFNTIQWGCKVPCYKVFSEKASSPVAFIVVVIDQEIAQNGYEYEIGAGIENILLASYAYGIGSVWIKSFQTEIVKKLIHINQDTLKVNSLIGLGFPDQEVKTVPMINKNYMTKVTKELNMEVPKRSEEEVIFWQTLKERSN